VLSENVLLEEEDVMDIWDIMGEMEDTKSVGIVLIHWTMHVPMDGLFIS